MAVTVKKEFERLAREFKEYNVADKIKKALPEGKSGLDKLQKELYEKFGDRVVEFKKEFDDSSEENIYYSYSNVPKKLAIEISIITAMIPKMDEDDVFEEFGDGALKAKLIQLKDPLADAIADFLSGQYLTSLELLFSNLVKN